jgi:hypothetical protein
MKLIGQEGPDLDFSPTPLSWILPFRVKSYGNIFGKLGDGLFPIGHIDNDAHRDFIVRNRDIQFSGRFM